MSPSFRPFVLSSFRPFVLSVPVCIADCTAVSVSGLVCRFILPAVCRFFSAFPPSEHLQKLQHGPSVQEKRQPGVQKHAGRDLQQQDRSRAKASGFQLLHLPDHASHRRRADRRRKHVKILLCDAVSDQIPHRPGVDKGTEKFIRRFAGTEQRLEGDMAEHSMEEQLAAYQAAKHEEETT